MLDAAEEQDVALARDALATRQAGAAGGEA
jgi:hypothetical protein